MSWIKKRIQPVGLGARRSARRGIRMSNFFNLDSPLMRALGKLADLIVLNFLTMICCIPIVTAGAAFTALHYMCLKIVRDEESYLVRGFFKSFKENFKQATIIWLIILWVVAIIIGDVLVMYYSSMEFHFIVRTAVGLVTMITLCTSMFVFPMQAKFVNPVSTTIKNAFKACMLQFPKTLLMVALLFVPVLIVVFAQMWMPLIFLFGFSFHAYLSAMLYNKFFLRLEDAAAKKLPQKKTEENDDERIFHDELDPEIAAMSDQGRQ